MQSKRLPKPIKAPFRFGRALATSSKAQIGTISDNVDRPIKLNAVFKLAKH